MRPYVTTWYPFRGHPLQNPWEDGNSSQQRLGFPLMGLCAFIPPSTLQSRWTHCASEKVSREIPEYTCLWCPCNARISRTWPITCCTTSLLDWHDSVNGRKEALLPAGELLCPRKTVLTALLSVLVCWMMAVIYSDFCWREVSYNDAVWWNWWPEFIYFYICRRACQN